MPEVSGNERTGQQSQPGSQPSGSENGEGSSNEGESQSQTPASPPPPTATGQSEFAHTHLKGRSNQEIESYVRTLEATNREQARMLRETSAAPAERPAESSRQSEITDQVFWNQPVTTIRSIVGEMLEATIKPFRDDLSETRLATAWDQLSREFPDFGTYRPLVEQLVTQYKVESPTADHLKSFYYMAKGYMASQQGEATPAAPAAPAPPPVGGGRPAPPQHPVSAHPLPASGQQGETLRPLSELERRLAREMFPGMSEEQRHKEFIKWQTISDDEVLTTEVNRG